MALNKELLAKFALECREFYRKKYGDTHPSVILEQLAKGQQKSSQTPPSLPAPPNDIADIDSMP